MRWPTRRSTPHRGLFVPRCGPISERRLQLHVSDAELAARLADWQAPELPLASGYWRLYVDHVLQADEGADLDFLVGKRGAFVPRDNH